MRDFPPNDEGAALSDRFFFRQIPSGSIVARLQTLQRAIAARVWCSQLIPGPMAATTRSLLSRQRRWRLASSWPHPMVRSISWFYIWLAFDLDLGLYPKFERGDLPGCR